MCSQHMCTYVCILCRAIQKRHRGHSSPRSRHINVPPMAPPSREFNIRIIRCGLVYMLLDVLSSVTCGRPNQLHFTAKTTVSMWRFSVHRPVCVCLPLVIRVILLHVTYVDGDFFIKKRSGFTWKVIFQSYVFKFSFTFIYLLFIFYIQRIYFNIETHILLNNYIYLKAKANYF